MPCYHPLKAVRTNTLLESGKRKIVFWRDTMNEDEVIKSGCDIIQLPCGNCLGCRLEYSRQWAVRCSLESKKWNHNYFVTLTYDNEHVPISTHQRINKETGEVDTNIVMTLVPDDLKNFMKRLRTYSNREYGSEEIRFFACGEYGPLNMRPHYHLILFNCPLPDLVFEKSENGYTYYRSPFLEKVWKRGFVLVTDFSFDTSAYVARYMLKKHKGKDASFYEEHGIVPEFTRCSRRPGIGKYYFDENRDKIYDFDTVIISNGKGSPLKLKPPKYYDRLFDDIDPVKLEELKVKRKDTAVNSMRLQLDKTDVPELEYLQVKENNKSLSISHLKRSL